MDRGYSPVQFNNQVRLGKNKKKHIIHGTRVIKKTNQTHTHVICYNVPDKR